MKILFIDSENVKNRVKTIFKKNNPDKDFDLLSFNFIKLFSSIEVDTKMFYAAKLKVFSESRAASLKFIDEQRKLQKLLEKNNIKFIFGGHVRKQMNELNKFVFREKGVDVQIATDIVEMICMKDVTEIFLMSSDSDLQPVIKIAKKYGVRVNYVAFENYVNLGLLSTTDHTIKISEKLILECYTPVVPNILDLENETEEVKTYGDTI